MIAAYTPEQLIAFEEGVVNLYRLGEIKSPVHLSGGNEKELIEVFKEVNPEDFIFTTYRSHYHALLKGVPHERLLRWVKDNKSIHFMDSEYNIFSSAIVGGTLPIALGMALAKKLNNIPGKVWCFIGDMTASLGTFQDCLEYAINFSLPIIFVIEDNGLSTDTKTAAVLGVEESELTKTFNGYRTCYPRHIRYYKYTRTRPHYGIGEFVIFPDNSSKESGKGF
jgi:pyruvate dehydrogenase E1 component alpha subunit